MILRRILFPDNAALQRAANVSARSAIPEMESKKVPPGARGVASRNTYLLKHHEIWTHLGPPVHFGRSLKREDVFDASAL